MTSRVSNAVYHELQIDDLVREDVGAGAIRATRRPLIVMLDPLEVEFSKQYTDGQVNRIQNLLRPLFERELRMLPKEQCLDELLEIKEVAGFIKDGSDEMVVDLCARSQTGRKFLEILAEKGRLNSNFRNLWAFEKWQSRSGNLVNDMASGTGAAHV